MSIDVDGVLRLQRRPRLVLALLTIVAFANAVPNGFVWLDHWQVESGGLVAQSWAELLNALHAPLGAIPGWQGTAPYARPSVVLLFSALHKLAGAQPWPYHLVVVLIHLANVLLAFGLLLHFVEPPVAFFATAIFGVAPVQTAAVSWISGVADPLFTCGVLAAFRLQLALRTRHSAGGLMRGLALVSFAAALGAKETASVFPVLLVVAYLLFPSALPAAPRAGAASTARRLTVAVAPFFVVLLGAAVYRGLVLHGAAYGAALGAVSLRTRLFTVPRLIVSYVTLPLRFGSLTVCDDYLLSSHWDGASTAAALAVIVLLVVVVRWWHRWPAAAFGCVWMLAGLVPVLNVIPILHYRADRFFYFPLLGWSLTFVLLLQASFSPFTRWNMFSHRRARLTLSAVAVAFLAALVGLTIQRNTRFVDDLSLFEATVHASPECREAHTALGDAYLRSGRSAAAIEQYQLARAATPGRASYVVLPKVLINLGMAALDTGEFAAAEDAFNEAHQLQPDLLHPLFGLGIANLARGHVGAAVTWLEQAAVRAPNDPDVQFNLALGYDRLGRVADALAAYRRCLQLPLSSRTRAVAQRRISALSQAELPE